MKIQNTLDSKVILLEWIHTENKQNELVNNSISMLMQQLKMRNTIYKPVYLHA